MTAKPGAADQQSDASLETYHELVRTIERLHRRFLDILRIELMRLGVEDISPIQVAMLLAIDGEAVSVRDLVQRGSYLGSNASYNLKHLVEGGYVERSASRRDRRVAQLQLTDKGRALTGALLRYEAEHAGGLVRDPTAAEDLATTYRTLRRIERAWVHFKQVG